MCEPVTDIYSSTSCCQTSILNSHCNSWISETCQGRCWFNRQVLVLLGGGTFFVGQINENFKMVPMGTYNLPHLPKYWLETVFTYIAVDSGQITLLGHFSCLIPLTSCSNYCAKYLHFGLFAHDVIILCVCEICCCSLDNICWSQEPHAHYHEDLSEHHSVLWQSEVHAV